MAIDKTMKYTPDLPRFREYAAQGNVVPVWMELTADGETPVSVYHKLRSYGASFLFESVTGGEHIGRFSFVGSGPSEVIEAYSERTRITGPDGQVTEQPTPADPLKLVEQRMAQINYVAACPDVPFSGGAVGFLAHEYVSCIEPAVPRSKKDVLGVPLMSYAFMDTVLVFDHVRQLIRIVCNARIESPARAQEAYQAAVQTIQQTLKRLSEGQPLVPVAADLDVPVPELEGNMSRADYQGIVERAKEAIRAGDIVQVVASQRFDLPFEGDPLDLYRALRIVNPSPYMVMLQTGTTSIVGASPEVHVRSTGGRVEIRPIAGTRQRGHTPQEDAQLEAELLADPKERAEHLMLVDLARNDIGRVCEVGSVQVRDYAAIERYSHVMHIVSQVEGRLSADHSVFDLMRATFPAGTLSGAPKVRALQIIAESEQEQRGVYGGALGYFSYAGHLDSCIAIRTAVIQGKTVHVQAGAGLVAESKPAAEYDETVNKAKGLLKAIALSKNLGKVGHVDVSRTPTACA
jgi:anthranilate synthase component 1